LEVGGCNAFAATVQTELLQLLNCLNSPTVWYKKFHYMKIEHRPEGDLGSFVALEGDKEAGELAYRMTGPKEMCLDHTDVEPEFEGKGVGKRLVQAAVDHARTNDIKIRPLCSYAVLLFERNNDWVEVRAETS
jgi:uncharacterized protein